MKQLSHTKNKPILIGSEPLNILIYENIHYIIGSRCGDLDNIKIIIEIIILINYLMDMDGLKTWNSMEDVLDLGSMKRIS